MKTNTMKDMVIPVVVLAVICLVISALLGVTNGATKDVIKANEYRATLNGFVSVITSANSTEDLELHEETPVEGALSYATTADGSVGVRAEAKGFDGGIVYVIVGFDPNGVITGVSVDASTQTPGIGSKLGDPEVGDKNVGKTFDGPQEFTVAADGVTGATYSSKAYFEALNTCIACYKEVA